MINEVRRTKSGVFVREDQDLGLLVYSPYSGLVFACQKSDSKTVINWLNRKSSKAPSSQYEKALGSGWLTSSDAADYPIPHLLPSASAWKIVPRTKYPILINWLITGRCPLKCRYCYAEDMMRGRIQEPSSRDIEYIAKNILSYHPLVVVLTGGDPLFSSHFERALRLLHNKTGIIVDTCGLALSQNQIELMKEYNVFARISFDSELPRVNNKLRPIIKDVSSIKTKNAPLAHISSAESALNSISWCIESGVKVAVQTVATKHNYVDFESLGDKLFRLGVNGWRILMMAPSKMNSKEYGKLIGTKENKRRLLNYIIGRLHANYEKEWKGEMSVQVAHNSVLNSVILVAPDGSFYTESNIGLAGKVVIDEKHPKQPRLHAIYEKVNIYEHVGRYLNLGQSN